MTVLGYEAVNFTRPNPRLYGTKFKNRAKSSNLKLAGFNEANLILARLKFDAVFHAVKFEVEFTPKIPSADSTHERFRLRPQAQIDTLACPTELLAQRLAP